MFINNKQKIELVFNNPKTTPKNKIWFWAREHLKLKIS